VALVDDLDHAIEVAEAFAPSTSRSTPSTPQGRRAIRYAGTTFIGALTPVSLGDYAAGPEPHPADLGDRPVQRRADHLVVPRAGQLPRGGRRRPAGSPTTSVGSPTRRTSRPLAAVEVRFETGVSVATTRPVTRTGRARPGPRRSGRPRSSCPTARRSSTSPVRLNTNETAEPPPPGYLEEVGERLQGLELNRYPDREHRAAPRARHRLGVPPSRCGPPTAPTRSSSSCSRPTAARTALALSVRPGYSMYPELCRTSLTPPCPGRPRRDFRLTPRIAAEAVATHDPDLILLPSPNNPGRHARRARGHPRAARSLPGAGGRRRGLHRVRRRPPRCPAPARRARRLVIVRTFSKAFRLAGLRLGYLVGPTWVVDDVQRSGCPTTSTP
jgi:hypothetical protein